MRVVGVGLALAVSEGSGVAVGEGVWLSLAEDDGVVVGNSVAPQFG